jgi:EpsI family protein
VTSRRDLIIGGACVLSAGAVLALKPTREVSLMPPGKKLSEIIPSDFNDWTSRDVSDLYAPETPDSLLARLYGETVGKIYSQQGSGIQIMMLMAHGDSQSNELQLHRPEVCYPAYGFSIVESLPVQLTLQKPVTLPGRRMVAETVQEKDAVTYWTRLGEYFPVGVTEQRLERLQTAIHRYVPDGLLARFSIAGSDTASAFRVMEAFISDLVLHTAENHRAALIGTARARLLSTAQGNRKA